MEHVLRNPSGPGRHPWRTIAVVAVGVAALELVGLVVVGVTLLARPVMHRAKADVVSTAPAANTTAKSPVRSLPPRGSVSVTVLNGNGVAGAAATEASRVRARGYLIGEVGNAPRSGYGRSVVMYRGGRRGEALRLARDLGIRLVTPLDGLRPRDLLGAHLAVVIGG